MSRECGKFYSRSADLLAIKKNLNKSSYGLATSKIRSVNICIKGSRERKANKMEKKKNYTDDSNDIEYIYGIGINKE